MSTGAELIATERRRQVEELGWTAAHDKEHTDGALAMAAVCYAAHERVYVKRETAVSIEFGDPWPWDAKFDKRRYKNAGNVVSPNYTVSKKERIQQLIKAGALIAAEIDRLVRPNPQPKEDQ